jgi:hypothetical protein
MKGMKREGKGRWKKKRGDKRREKEIGKRKDQFSFSHDETN